MEDARPGHVHVTPDAYMCCKADAHQAYNKISGHASEERQCLMPSCAWWNLGFTLCSDLLVLSIWWSLWRTLQSLLLAKLLLLPFFSSSCSSVSSENLLMKLSGCLKASLWHLLGAVF